MARNRRTPEQAEKVSEAEGSAPEEASAPTEFVMVDEPAQEPVKTMQGNRLYVEGDQDIPAHIRLHNPPPKQSTIPTLSVGESAEQIEAMLESQRQERKKQLLREAEKSGVERLMEDIAEARKTVGVTK